MLITLQISRFSWNHREITNKESVFPQMYRMNHPSRIHCGSLWTFQYKRFDSAGVVHCVNSNIKDSAGVVHCVHSDIKDSAGVVHCERFDIKDSAGVVHCEHSDIKDSAVEWFIVYILI